MRSGRNEGKTAAFCRSLTHTERQTENEAPRDCLRLVSGQRESQRAKQIRRARQIGRAIRVDARMEIERGGRTASRYVAV